MKTTIKNFFTGSWPLLFWDDAQQARYLHRLTSDYAELTGRFQLVNNRKMYQC